MVEPLRHRQTKGAATDMFGLQPPRHTPTLPSADLAGGIRNRVGREPDQPIQHEGSRSSIAPGCNCGPLPMLCGAACDVSVALEGKVHQLIDWGASKLSCIGKANAGAASPQG